MKWADGKIRCCWANPRNERYIRYHDEEWGVPVHDDRKLFEMLILECACATDPSGISPVAGTTGIMPDVYTVPFTSIACEYGPIAAGALSVLITFFILYSSFCLYLHYTKLLRIFPPSNVIFLSLYKCPMARLNAALLNPVSLLITSGLAFSENGSTPA